MTIRIYILSLFALLCFMMGGIAAPHQSYAANDGAQVAPAQNDHSPMGGGGFRQRMKDRRENAQNDQGGAGENHGQNQGMGQMDPARQEQRREQLREELMKLPPEERRAKIETLKEQMNEGRAQKLEERKNEFQNKWDSATPEQRARFCGNVQQKCASGGQGAQFACTVAKTKCEGQ